MVAEEQVSEGAARSGSRQRATSAAKSAGGFAKEGKMADSGDAENGDEGKGRSKRKRLLLVLLALVAVVLLVLLLMTLLGGSDKKKSAEAAPGTVTADGQPLVPTPPSGLGGLAGHEATGNAVVVQSVNGNEGFFVGPTVADRVYIEWGGDVGENEPSRFKPKVDETVNLTGKVRKASKQELKRLGLPVDSEELVEQQGGFVNAETVTAAK